MGRQTQTPNFLYENPADADSMIFKEDDYIRHNLDTTPDPVVRQLLLPLWRIRSQYRDTIIPIERNISDTQATKKQIEAATTAMSLGHVSHPGIKLLISEAAQSIQIYSAYLDKLQSLRTCVDYIFHSYALHATEMVEKFQEDIDAGGVYTGDFSHRIVCSLEMCLLLRRALNDSIATGKDVLVCALANLREMTCYYYVTNNPLPSPSPSATNSKAAHMQAQGIAIMKAFWNQFRREGRKQDWTLRRPSDSIPQATQPASSSTRSLTGPSPRHSSQRRGYAHANTSSQHKQG